tara:strand:- start:1275 stop:1745 length:471 start_codon:yes stop_codon:yes gene_type:complete
MLFFYIGLGLSMFTTVVQIFEISTTISKQSYINKPKTSDSYEVLIKRQNDRRFLKLLNDIEGNSLGVGSNICVNIKKGITDELDSNYAILSKYSELSSYNTSIPLSSTHPRFHDGCALSNNSHRVLITPSLFKPNTYTIYSCIMDVQPECSFEQIN